MLTVIIMMYVLAGVGVTLIVLSSCIEEIDGMDEITKLWLVTRWVLGWPWRLYKAFHEGVLIRA